MDTVSSYAGVDPELASALGELPFDLGAALGVLSNDTIGAVRDAVAQMPPPELSDRVERVDYEVPDSGGVIVRMHRPSTRSAGCRVSTGSTAAASSSAAD